jgi:hypothetical protein
MSEPKLVSWTMRDKQTGEVRSGTFGHVESDEEIAGLEFQWSEGNQACDCARHHEFYGRDDDIECGEGRFELLSLKAGEERLRP